MQNVTEQGDNNDSSSPMKRLTILICTHNRAELLDKVIQSLNQAQHPKTWTVDILVAANACKDGTHFLLDNYRQQQSQQGWLKFEWFAEPTPGKSNALNAAIPLVKTSDIVAFVDDDHQVDVHYLEYICRTADANPRITMLCGRILPGWDGSEPVWVHDQGPYKIRPLSIPRSDSSPSQKELSSNDPTPSGSSPFLRSPVFDRTGFFQSGLDPHGRYLDGSEVANMFRTLLAQGAKICYRPDMAVSHLVEAWRLRRGYFLKLHYRADIRYGKLQMQDNDNNILGAPLFLITQLLTQFLKTISKWIRAQPGLLRQSMNAAHA